eukprot:TRINITY_DN11343_c0_g2_i7.p2 TRINITY_DN11343_c0_g2~~TRINITY_DN11343_c0_g2_i7.p2  ORF type:complete len:136 (-),score=7.87 TRINITY_DN11343_c0_g2_i7:147-554(-)
MKWSEGFYQDIFCKYGDFKLRENDYVFGELKFGGNAQAITGKRWLHHTSFLWDYNLNNMKLLKNPSRAPKYREGRDHEQFLCKLKDFLPNQLSLFEGIVEKLKIMNYDIQNVTLEDVVPLLQQQFKRTSTQVQIQ